MTEDSDTATRRPAPLVIIFTGMSGAGRTTAISALEDLGYEALNNFPLSLFDPLVAQVSDQAQPIAIGIETRTRGFSVRALTEAVTNLRQRWRAGVMLVFLDSRDDVLLKRFSETRRRHPLAPAEDPMVGITRERGILADVRGGADAVIDTSDMTPHELKSELKARFSLDRSVGLTVSVQSFSYKRGTPSQADMVMDCRFLRNPYWEEALRPLDGRDPRIQDFVREDAMFEAFMEKLEEMVLMLLPAYQAEGKAYFSVALGCTGGRHRSVSVATLLARTIEEAGWPVAVHHRELGQAGAQRTGGGT